MEQPLHVMADPTPLHDLVQATKEGPLLTCMIIQREPQYWLHEENENAAPVVVQQTLWSTTWRRLVDEHGRAHFQFDRNPSWLCCSVYLGLSFLRAACVAPP